MKSNLFVNPIFLLTVYFCFLISSGYRVPGLRLSEESEEVDDNDSNNETSFQQSLENNSTNTTEGDVLFWMLTPTADKDEILLNETKPEAANDETVIPDLNETEATNDGIFPSEKPTESLGIDQIVEENKENVTPSQVNTATVSTMDEEITLERNNCQLEIMVRETHDLKIQIKFGKLENNTSGKCCITLNSDEGTMLGVLISNLQLYQNASQGEVLKIITADYGTDFILKEYYSWSKYQPLILTETHRVYIVLQYKITHIPLNQQESHFNLEVFSYHKYENDIHQQETSYSKSFFHSKNDMGMLYKKEKPVFIPFFY